MKVTEINDILDALETIAHIVEGPYNTVSANDIARAVEDYINELKEDLSYYQSAIENIKKLEASLYEKFTLAERVGLDAVVGS